MEGTKKFLLTVTQRIFSNWTALRLAVEHDMGPKDRAVEFCTFVTEVLCMNEGLNSSEIALELEEYMDEYFNTEMLDGSTMQIAEELLRFYRYCLEGKESVALTELERLPSLQPWLIVPFGHHKCHSVPAQYDSSSDEDMDTDANGKNSDGKDKGWVQVRKR